MKKLKGSLFFDLPPERTSEQDAAGSLKFLAFKGPLIFPKQSQDSLASICRENKRP